MIHILEYIKRALNSALIWLEFKIEKLFDFGYD